MENNKEILQTEELDIGYSSSNIIQNTLNLRANKGEMICIMGVNGSGKSTLIRTLSGLQKKINGSIKIDNKELNPNKPKTLANLISVVLTDRIDDINLTVYDMICLGQFPYSSWIGKLTKENKQIVNQTIELLNLQTYLNKFIYQLSDGELKN